VSVTNSIRLSACVVVSVALTALWVPTIAAAGWTRGAREGNPYSSAPYAPRGAHLPFGGSQRAVCGRTELGGGHCLIHVLQPSGATPAARPSVTITAPTGLSPSTIKSVYGYSTSASAGAGKTIALVDAYNDPDAASDLSKFSAQYGLPAECTSGSVPPSCFDFTQVNQTGGSSLPATNSGWDLEISLDIEWAHAIAPGASILLVEASSESYKNLLAAEQYAAEHASYVSNSWGGNEFSGETSDDSYFTRTGVSFFAAAGDEEESVLWPSASPDVTSVGGTSLTLTSAGTLAREEAWSEGGGGCSRYETASPAQVTGSVSCAGKRATPDISLDADPNSGVSVYDSITYERQSGWWTVGGTSASTAMTAAQAAVHGTELSASYLYASPANIPYRDIILGSNGYPTLTGYDLATGLGSWSYTPGAPTGLTATRGSGGVKLSWSAPSGAPVGEYNIWRGTAPGEETTDIATVTAPTVTYTDTSATGSLTYYYEIQPVNEAGVGPFSDQALAAPPSTPPVASFSTSCTRATCSFSSTSTDAQGTIDAYAWNGGNGVTGSGSTFSDTYSAQGTDTVTLTVTNTAGQSSAPASEKVTCSISSTTNRRGKTKSTLTCS
jgi:subtilase family serine protease